MLLEDSTVVLHATALDPGSEHHLIRIFAAPSGPLEKQTGQPWKPYFATCLVSVKDGVGEVTGALTLPRYSLPPLRDLGRKLKLRKMWFQRWDERTLTKLEPTVIDL